MNQNEKILRFPQNDPEKMKASQQEKAQARQDLLNGKITAEKYYQIVHRGRELCPTCGRHHE